MFSDSVPTVDREPEVPVSSGRGGGGVGGGFVNLSHSWSRRFCSCKWRATAPPSSQQQNIHPSPSSSQRPPCSSLFQISRESRMKNIYKVCTLLHRSNDLQSLQHFYKMYIYAYRYVRVSMRNFIYAYLVKVSIMKSPISRRSCKGPKRSVKVKCKRCPL